MSQTNDNATPDARRPKGKGWLGRQRNRLSLSMLLSVCLHLAVAGAALLVLLYAHRAAPSGASGELNVKLTSVEPPGPVIPSSPGGESGRAGDPARSPAPQDSVEDPAKALSDEHRQKAARKAEEIKSAADRAAADAAEQATRKAAQAILAELKKQGEDIAAALDRNQASLARAQQEAREALEALSGDAQRRRRWARWRLQLRGLLAIENAGGRLLVMNWPRRNRHTYVSDVASRPRTSESARLPRGYSFVPSNRAALLLLFGGCRRAGIKLEAGRYVPCLVFSRAFETRLAELEAQEKVKRDPQHEKRIRQTVFQLHDDGSVTVLSMTFE